MNELSIIVAVSDNMAIGRDGDMPWHLPEDLKYFKRITSGKCVIMGRRTFESLGSRPLPNRRNIVITSDHSVLSGFNPSPETSLEWASSLDEAISTAFSIGEDNDINTEAFVIGGGMVYRQALGKATKLYLTKVHVTVHDADTFFPMPDIADWKEIWNSGQMKDSASGINYEFIQYLKK